MVFPFLIGILFLLVSVSLSNQQQQYHRDNANCPFNTMCTCQWSLPDDEAITLQYGEEIEGLDINNLQSVACLGVPLTKLPSKLSFPY